MKMKCNVKVAFVLANLSVITYTGLGCEIIKQLVHWPLPLLITLKPKWMHFCFGL